MEDIKALIEELVPGGYEDFSKAMNTGEWKRIHTYCWERKVHKVNNVNFVGLFNCHDLCLMGWGSDEVAIDSFTNEESVNPVAWDLELFLYPTLQNPNRVYGITCHSRLHSIKVEGETHMMSGEMYDGTEEEVIAILTNEVRTRADYGSVAYYNRYNVRFDYNEPFIE